MSKNKTTKKLSLRGIFNKVKAHLLKQNARSMLAQGCAYRGRDGLKCAVGCLIKAKAYKPSLEGSTARCDAVVEALKKSGVSTGKRSRELVEDLQGVHDGWQPEFWAERLAEIERGFFGKASKAGASC